MPSVVDVCNKALEKVGHKTIISLDDGTDASNRCKRSWPLIRDEVLRAHPWNFAVKRINTAPDATAPDWGFTYRHAFPAKCLRILEIRDLTTDDYSIEGRWILADADTLYLRYIESVEDPNQYDALFIEAVAARLAAELSERFTQNNRKKAMLVEEYKEALRMARIVDAQENPTVTFVEDEWITARL